jgi:uncharacterized protein (DUF2267 family)
MANRPYDASYEPRPGERSFEEDLRHTQFLDALVRAGLGPRHRAEAIAVAVLAHIERRITGGEARDLNLELPWKLRDAVRRRAGEPDPRSRPERFGRDELLSRVAADVGASEAEVEGVVRTVLAHVRALLSDKEASDVIGQLPPDMQALWAPPA